MVGKAKELFGTFVSKIFGRPSENGGMSNTTNIELTDSTLESIPLPKVSLIERPDDHRKITRR